MRLIDNYRGIQIICVLLIIREVQPLLPNLYDRIICNRLLRWAKINDEQTAFQKGKSTIDQIFILRIIMSTRLTNRPFYG